MADFGFTDPNDPTPDAFTGVIITTGLGAGTGSLTFNNGPVGPNQLIPIGQIGQLIYRAPNNAFGAGLASFTFQVKDSGGTVSGGQDTDLTPRNMTINVTGVNDPPTSGDSSVTVNEDQGVQTATPFAFRVSDFPFADATDNPSPNSLGIVKVVSVNLNGGTLLNNNVAVGVGSLISVNDLNNHVVIYTPPSNKSGANFAGFTFQVQDDGLTANSGIDLDSAVHAMSISVNSVNDVAAGRR